MPLLITSVKKRSLKICPAGSFAADENKAWRTARLCKAMHISERVELFEN
jgi:hypothetical protein